MHRILIVSLVALLLAARPGRNTPRTRTGSSNVLTWSGSSRCEQRYPGPNTNCIVAGSPFLSAVCEGNLTLGSAFETPSAHPRAAGVEIGTRILAALDAFQSVLLRRSTWRQLASTKPLPNATENPQPPCGRARMAPRGSRRRLTATLARRLRRGWVPELRDEEQECQAPQNTHRSVASCAWPVPCSSFAAQVQRPPWRPARVAAPAVLTTPPRPGRPRLRRPERPELLRPGPQPRARRPPPRRRLGLRAPRASPASRPPVWPVASSGCAPR